MATAKDSSADPTSGSASAPDVEETSQVSGDILVAIDSFKKNVAVERCILIRKKMEENKEKLQAITNHVYSLSKHRRDTTESATNKTEDLLSKRKEDAICKLMGLNVAIGEKDRNSCHEDSLHASSAVLGNNLGGKNVTRPIKLQEVKKLPPYTTWIFLDRNQRMSEDQSVVGRRRIYYDPTGGEALICTDSEEEAIDEEEEKKEFGENEDYILRMTILKVGQSDAVLDSLAKFFDRKPSEIKARYENLLIRENIEPKGKVDVSMEDAFADKDLDAALDSFDNLFCRRCLVFDCRLHGCSQDLVYPAEKQLPWSFSDEEKGMPCSAQCFRMPFKSESIAMSSSSLPNDPDNMLIPLSGSAGDQMSLKNKTALPSIGRRPKSNQSESASSNAKVVSESSESEIRPLNTSSPSKDNVIGKFGSHKRSSKRDAGRLLLRTRKRRKNMAASDSDSGSGSHVWPINMKLRSNSRKGCKDVCSSSQMKAMKPVPRKSRKKESLIYHNPNLGSYEVEKNLVEMGKEPSVTTCDETIAHEEFFGENTFKDKSLAGIKSWNTIEKSLFAKGLEIFGRNSCLIARNLLNGMKTCTEVSLFMSYNESKLSCPKGNGTNSHFEGSAKDAYVDTAGGELRRSRFMRRRGRVRRLKYTWKSAGYHSIRKRITERKDQPCRQYNPCSCQSACGKQCTCLLNGTCCEKYCGCPKSCKNRFRGCHCAKSQCRSRQCPCFAADRECDPDVCRNCWVGCGDGTLGGPPQRGDNYECRNMKLLLKQQQRVLLGRSDVSGWGAFLKNSVNKHEYLGEYTGELISHREADKRGKIYDRENSSFLFNLNDQFVLDAYRKGDKLKFANHSPDPNCYAKVIMVAGDHRVGIFAKERIYAGEELFYDYRYEPDRAPAWARKPEGPGSKKDEAPTSTGRAKKLA